MMGYSAINAGNIIRARALIIESLRGNRRQGHIPGQLACLIALGTCELVEGNVAKAITLASFAENRMHDESISLMEPDADALNRLLTAGKEKLGRKSFELASVKAQSLRIEDIVAGELPSAV